MKRCPSCDRDFEDDSLKFCPHDGAGLLGATPAAPVELQATMMATPPSLGSGSYSPPSNPGQPDSGSFNQPPPSSSTASNPPSGSQAWPAPATSTNQTWSASAANQTPKTSKSALANPKILIAGIGCLGLGAIIVVVAVIVALSMSGASSKMSPYKGDLKELAPQKLGTFTQTDIDILKERDKEGFGKVNDALGLAYKNEKDVTVRTFVGNYSTADDAEDGFREFKETKLNKDWSKIEDGSKRIGWRTVGKRYVAMRNPVTSSNDERTLRDGSKLIYAQSASPTIPKVVKIVCWTNGSVIFCAFGEEDSALSLEKVWDETIK